MNVKTLDIQKPNLGDEMPKVMWASMGNLVPQLSGVVTFAYDLRFRRVIARWKGILENYTLCHQIFDYCLQFDYGETKKHYLGPQNGPGSTTRCVDMKKYKISQLD
jgi:hypothetical protein